MSTSLGLVVQGETLHETKKLLLMKTKQYAIDSMRLLCAILMKAKQYDIDSMRLLCVSRQFRRQNVGKLGAQDQSGASRGQQPPQAVRQHNNAGFSGFQHQDNILPMDR